MQNITEYLAKKHQLTNLITLKEVFDEGNTVALIVYFYKDGQFQKGYIISSNEKEICDITKLDNFVPKHDYDRNWPDSVYDNINSIVKEKIGETIDFSYTSNSYWIVQTIKLKDFTNRSEKYYDIR